MTHQPVSLATFLLVGAITLTLAACSNDNGGNSGGGHPPAPSAALVYLADQDIEGVDELYLLGSNGTSTKLNPALPVGRSVTRFRITPDKTAVVYRADQDTDDLLELYRVPLATPGVSTKLNGPLGAQGKKEFFDFQFTPDSSAVVYRVHQDDAAAELYRVSLATPGVSTKLNSPLGANGDVLDFQVTPDSSAVLYTASPAPLGIPELYRVLLTTPRVSTKLNGPLEGYVQDVHVTPDSSAGVYLANLKTTDSFRLYRASFVAPGVSTELNGPLVANGGSVQKFQVTPDGSAVVYRAVQDTDGVIELYRVPLATPGVSTKLNGPLVAHGGVRDFAFP